jgi:C1A family cysteine protease
MKRKNSYYIIIGLVCMIQCILGPVTFADDSLPPRYDLRDSNKVTDIKNQEQTNYCWAFASMASLESSLLTAYNRSYDFNEYDMISASTDFDIDLINAGGTMDMAIAYFINGHGPLYDVNDSSKDFYVGDIRIIPPRKNAKDNQKIKSALIKNGGLYASMQYDDAYFNQDTHAYYCNSFKNNKGHAVTIVGWDDAYSKDNFGPVSPPADGAFICKNQYGKAYGDQGYFYVSYYDYFIGKNDNALFMVADSKYADNKIYSHTPFGKTSFISYGSDVTFANRFTTGPQDELLSGLGFFINQEEMDYEIYLIENPLDKNNLPDKAIAKGSLKGAGYHTIGLPSTSLKKESNFMVAVRLLGSSNEIAIEGPEKNYASKADAKKGQSYLLDQGYFVDLQDLDGFDKTNVCLNVLTDQPSQDLKSFELSNVKWSNLKTNSLSSLSLCLKNKTEEEKTIAMGLCVYEDHDGYLEMMRSSFLEESLSSKEDTILSMSCFVPNAEKKYILKAFIWDNSAGEKILLASPLTTEINGGQ